MRAHIFATQAIAFSGRLVQRQQRAADHDEFKPQRSPHPLSCIFPPALLRSLPLSVIPSPSPSVVFFGWVMASMSSPSPLVDREAPQSFAADNNGLACHRCRQQYPCSRVPRHHGRFERRWDGRGDEWRFRGWGGRCSERGSDQGTERENKHAGGRERAVAFGCG